MDPVLYTDPDGTLQFVNPAFEDLTGFSAEDGRVTARVLAERMEPSLSSVSNHLGKLKEIDLVPSRR